MTTGRGFEIVCEIEPPTKPDLTHARHQIGVLSPVASAFLIPDNHLGRATVSSVAVAHEVQRMGGRSVACVNARDRNLLGLRRDVLTAAAYGVNEFLLVYGDRSQAAASGDALTIGSMLDDIRMFSDGPAFEAVPDFRLGVTSRLAPIPSRKHSADFLFAQVTFSLDALLRWRESAKFDGPVYAGVMVLASASMASKLASEIHEIEIPDDWVHAVDADPGAGVELACSYVESIRESGAFDGVHLVPVSRYREVAARLERTS
ncbi:MAG TPA: methylenetetrahydrofolate reductase [Acidimicrobiia bacterium]|jgi:5,10-methylenetetrahydrofolate reductase